jgi:asparagine synthase (glutamine-hydrolysing)
MCRWERSSRAASTRRSWWRTWQRARPLDTFTIGFDDSALDEAPFARAVAERFGTRHHELTVGAGDATPDVVTQVLDHFDQPFADSSAIPTWLVARETRRFVKAVISGDGGDELFGGYVAYQTAARLATLRRIPSPARSALAACTRALGLLGAPDLERRLQKALAIARLSPGEALAALRSYFDEPAKAALYRPEQARRVAGHRTSDYFSVDARSDLASAMATCDLSHRLAGDMLCKVDMMSMWHGLEVRVPLLDERIVDLALEIPPHLKLRRGVTKYLLRRAARRRLPERVVTKPKGGFVLPLRRAAGPAMTRLLDETIGAPRPRLAEIMRPEALAAYARAYRGEVQLDLSRWQLEQRVFALVALERWLGRAQVSA